MALVVEDGNLRIFTNETTRGWRWTLAREGGLVASPRDQFHATEADAIMAARQLAAAFLLASGAGVIQQPVNGCTQIPAGLGTEHAQQGDLGRGQVV